MSSRSNAGVISTSLVVLLLIVCLGCGRQAAPDAAEDEHVASTQQAVSPAGACTLQQVQNCQNNTPPCKTFVSCSSGVCTYAGCSAGTACNHGTCAAGCNIGGTFYSPNAVNPSNACQVCTPSTSTSAWSNEPNGTACSDGNACTQTDTCQAGVCTGTNPVVCTAQDQCHVAGSCNTSTGVCSNPAKADGTACNDGNACTQTDTCQAGVCTGGNPVVCTAQDQCHNVGTCDTSTGRCSNPVKADGAACNDGNGCTQTDTCQAGVCTGSNPVVCTAQDQCHVAGTCNPSTGVCSNPAKVDGTACNDGNACTQTDTCQAGVCAGSNPIVCAAQDQCHVAGTCNTTTGVCSNPAKADGAACNDGNACTQTDTCQAGVCAGSNPIVCAAQDQCHVAGTCNTSTGVCSNPAKADGTACNDGNACTQTDTCQAGACTGSNPVVCAAQDQCHVAGTCNTSTGVCSNPAKADGTACDDGSVCTVNDACHSGACTGTSLPKGTSCSDDNPCNGLELCDGAGHCGAGVALAEGAVCGGDVCAPRLCSSGQCLAATPALDGTHCDLGDPCKQGAVCNAGACDTSASNGVSCDDGDKCNGTETCFDGVCQRGAPPEAPDGGAGSVQTCDPQTGVVTTTQRPPIDPTAPADVSSANGVLGGAVDPNTAAVLLGLVTDVDGTTPIPNVTISVVGAPGLGTTTTQLDGRFVMTVPGGGTVRVRYGKNEYVTVERSAAARWKEYTWLPDVIMTRRDPRVTQVDLGSSVSVVQSARGNLVSDADGVRQATVLVPPSTAAFVGTTQLSGPLHIRATELTVGPNGRAAMPADLPPATAYTYAVELTADEVPDTSSVRFVNAQNPLQPQALPFYLENFINFPVGTPVPMGYYDRQQGVWVPSSDGLVVEIVEGPYSGIDLGTTLNGSGQPVVVPSVKAAIGVTDAELAELAQHYPVGQKLWRVPVTHFTSWDTNWPYGAPGDACASNDTDCQPAKPADRNPKPDDGCTSAGSIIECQAQILGEAMPITGTPYSLHYASDRVRGRGEAYRLTIPLVGSKPPPQSLRRIELTIQVAGKKTTQTFKCPCAGLQPYVFDWDGTDVFGRPTQGAQPAMYELAYAYGAVYDAVAPSGTGSSFGGGGVDVLSLVYSANRAQNEVSNVRTWRGTLGLWDERGAGLGGWSVDMHHVYDPTAQVLYRGDGSRISNAGMVATLTSVVGSGENYPPFDCPSGTQGCSASTVYGGDPSYVASMPDGSIVFADPNAGRIRRLDPQGGATTLVQLANVGLMARAPDGTLYVGTYESAHSGYQIKKIDPSLTVTVLAGTGWPCDPGTTPCDFEGPATSAALGYLTGLSLGADGNLYVAQQFNVRRISPDGNIHNFAGVLTCSTSDLEGVPAAGNSVGMVKGILAAPDGQVYIASDGCSGTASKIRSVTPDGTLHTIAGATNGGSTDDGHSAVPRGTDPGAKITSTGPLTLTADGLLVFDDHYKVRMIDAKGLVQTIAGNPPPSCPTTFCGSGLPAAASNLGVILGLGTAPDGSLLVGSNLGRVLRITAPLPRYGFGAIFVPSGDGRELYKFDNNGRHLETYDALTNGLKYAFAYQNGRLSSITDAATQSFITTIGYADPTHPTITGPFGDLTKLALDANGNLSSLSRQGATDASSDEVYTLAASPDGLLASFRDPMGTVNASTEPAHLFSYDTSGAEPTGRLTRDQDPGGGDQSLSLASTKVGDVTTFEITKTVTQDSGTYATKFDVVTDKKGVETRTTLVPSASSPAVETIAKDGSKTATLPDGTTVTMAPHADPRFGMLSPTYKTTTTLPSPALSRVVDVQRSVDAQGRLHTTTSLNGKPFDIVLLSDGRTLQYTTPAGRTWTVKLDASGRAVQSDLTLLGMGSATTSFTSDFGQLDTTTRTAGAETRTTWRTYWPSGTGVGTVGRPYQLTNALLESVTFASYDRAGRLLSQSELGGRTTGYTYDLNGNRTEVDPPPATPQYGSTERLHAQHLFGYTALDQLASYQVRDQNAPPSTFLETTTYEYTKDRLLKDVLRPEGDHMSYANALGRLDQLTLPPGTGSVTPTYEPVTGRLLGLSGPMGVSLTFGYNGSLLTDVTWSGLGSAEMTLHREYDSDANHVSNFWVTQETLQGVPGGALYFAYDLDGLLQCVGTSQTTDCTGGLGLTRTTGTPLLSGTTFPVGATAPISDTYTPNGFGETLHYHATAGAQSVYSVDYTRDGLGRIETRNESLRNAGGTTTAASYTYSYDAAGRLTDVDHGDGTLVHYDYDANGNRLRRAVEQNGNVVSEELGTYAAGDQLETYDALTYYYTASGVLEHIVDATKPSGQNTTSFAYDALGNLRKVVLPDGTTIEYVIDGQSRRVGKKVGTQTSTQLVKAWLYEDGLRIAAEVEFDAMGGVTTTKRFAYGTKANLPDLMVMNGTRYRILSDHLGSPRMVVAETGGTIAARMDYDEFGRVLTNTQPGMLPFGFAGGLYDPDTGLVRFGVRDYDAENGRWVAKDPMRFDGGDANLFVYAMNDPINLRDPSGKIPWAEVIMPGLALFDPANWAGAIFTYLNVFDPYASTSFLWNRGDPVILLENSPFAFGNRGMTWGHVVALDGDRSNAFTLNHELAHVKQHNALANAYLPAHIVCQAVSHATSPNYSSNNPLEKGPYDLPPHPWP